jgi:hypothetical protein
MKWFIVFLIAANNGHTGSFAFENRGYDTPDACQKAVDDFYRTNARSPEVRMVCTGNHVVGEFLQTQMKKDQHK